MLFRQNDTNGKPRIKKCQNQETALLPFHLSPLFKVSWLQWDSWHRSLCANCPTALGLAQCRGSNVWAWECARWGFEAAIKTHIHQSLQSLAGWRTARPGTQTLLILSRPTSHLLDSLFSSLAYSRSNIYNHTCTEWCLSSLCHTTKPLVDRTLAVWEFVPSLWPCLQVGPGGYGAVRKGVTSRELLTIKGHL